MKSIDFEIMKASIFDMNKIVRMALFYHKDDPKFRETLSNPLKLFLYRLFGSLYVRLSLVSFKVVVSGKIVGYILLKRRRYSLHVWDLVVDSEFQGKGIGRSLMEFAERFSNNERRYLTLAVMEDNAPAMRLYEKLGYENLKFSPVCYRLERPKTLEKNFKSVKLEPIFEKAATHCRNKHFSSVLDAVVGPDKCEVVRLIYSLPSKIRRRTKCFRILAFEREIGYMSLRQVKDLATIFLIVNPDTWSFDAETEAVQEAIEKGYLKSSQVEICVMQAYEKNLENILKRANLTSERRIPRLALIKKLK